LTGTIVQVACERFDSFDARQLFIACVAKGAFNLLEEKGKDGEDLPGVVRGSYEEDGGDTE
jgi:hypothetical protein